MDIWNLIIEWYNSDKVAFIALVISLITGFFTFFSNRKKQKDDDKRQKAQDAFNKEAQEKLSDFQDFQKSFSEYQQITNELQFSIENQSNLKPYFHINRTKSCIEYDSNKKLYVKLYLTNVGRGTATNIMTREMRNDSNGNTIFFDQVPSLGKVTHGFHDYFSENFAIPNESINLEIFEIENNEEQIYFIEFKIKFSDVIGREYEQQFRFGYDNYLVRGINQNSTSYPPKLIKDIN
ncbi:hypothetical protein [Streptococcus pneumoniae]|uniref:hypothetical protein n=1 Tax=Streptococcus pneumoniae TaxID=1313 RepID=UPI0005DB28DC|nr:hypothetical protein [Streptococcus pneumoniae]CEW52924.1 Uncharacterised protein [Streptococcus pneumoniae]CEZ14905.1 Uncharacterised protein [Streptococcus pneumoniae]CIW31680.1 Uncharacterised protein [Streptococcus pneumoniae]CIX38646.1 Uncharacterised protein [Streptococcus pneumoniae]CIX41952.1 Uncharacterised protein [Streptococcus pneumoniae]